MNNIKKTFVVLLVILLVPVVANADIITYDISWTGVSGKTMSGVFTYDDSTAADGFVRDRDNDLLTLEISSVDYDLLWTWPGDPTDPFNFNFVVATELLPLDGVEGGTEAQSWNGIEIGTGLGFEANGGRSGLLIDGRVVDPTQSLLITMRAGSVPEPGNLALLGIGLAGMGLASRRKKV